MGGVDSLGSYKNGQWYDHGMIHGNLYEANIEYSFSDFTERHPSQTSADR